MRSSVLVTLSTLLLTLVFCGRGLSATSADAVVADVSALIPADHRGLSWIAVEGGGEWSGLVKDGRQIGAFNNFNHAVYYVDPQSGRWVRTESRAYSVEDARAAIELLRDPGVDWRKLQREASGYRIQGRPVTERDAFDALKPSPKLADDSMLPSLTIIGTEAECRGVEEDVARNPKLRALRSSFLVQSYRPNDLMVARYGFAAGGRPTIYLTDAKGGVIWRADEHPGGEVLGEAVQAGVEQCCPPRKPHPDYQPAKDPEPERVIRRASSWAWAWWIAGVLATVLAAMGCIVAGMVLCGVAIKLYGWMFRKPPSSPAAPAVEKGGQV